VAFLFQPGWMGWSTIFLCLLLLLFLLNKEKRVSFVLLLCFITGGFVFLIADNHVADKARLTGKIVEIQGVVLSQTEAEDHANLNIRSRDYGRVLVSIYQKDPDYTFAVGKGIQVSGLLEQPQTAGNPGGFDYRMYLRSVGIDSIMQVKPEEVMISEETINRFAHRIALFRHGFEEELIKQIGKQQAGLTIAMLFGDKSELEDEVYESFQRNGTAHILSVSGLHVGFLYGILMFLLGGKRKPTSNGIILLILVFYGIVSGFCPSVTRALLMIGIHILSKILCRPYDLLSSAGIAASILLIQNPYSLFHTGFQLSFLAVILMGWIFPVIGSLLPKGHILSMLLPIPALQAAMAPYTAFLFNYFSFGAFLANFGVVFFSGILIPVGLLAMISYQLSESFFEVSAIFIDLCIRCVVWCNDIAYAGGRTCMDVISPSVFILVVAYGLLLFGLSETGRVLWIRKKYKAIVWVLILCVASAGILDWKTENGFDQADAVFVDVGQGDCLHIRTPSGKNILIDGGGKESFDVGKRIVKPYLLKNGVKKIDLAIVTHLDIDHYEGVRSLAAEGMVESLGLYDGNQLLEKRILRETELKKDQLRYLHQGDRITVDSFLWLEVLYPAEKSHSVYESEILAKEENPRSLVVRVHLGKYRILMTGDLDAQAEGDVLSLQKDEKAEADILKICHHGSKYSTSDIFLQAVNPRIAVFQTGKNNYGHPSVSILEKCREKGIIIYRTDINGAIGLFGFYKGQNPTLRSVKKET
jgi:competence protein ComEC